MSSTDNLLPTEEQFNHDERVDILGKQRALMQDYLQMKVDEQDWHGCMDAAADLRDIDSELRGLNYGR